MDAASAGGDGGSLRRWVAESLAAAVSSDELVDVFVEIAPVMGSAGVVAEAAAALGFDISAPC